MESLEQNLNDYYKKYKLWNDERIRLVYDNLKKEEPVAAFIILCDNVADFITKELQYCKNGVKSSNSFMDVIPKKKDDFILYFWKDLESSLKIKDKNNEYEEFKNWFINLLKTDTDKHGLGIECNKWFVVTDVELEQDPTMSIDELFNLIQDSQLLSWEKSQEE